MDQFECGYDYDKRCEKVMIKCKRFTHFCIDIMSFYEIVMMISFVVRIVVM